MAPHWSGMSVETYVERVRGRRRADGALTFSFVREYGAHPSFVRFLAARLESALADGALDRALGHARPVHRALPADARGGRWVAPVQDLLPATTRAGIGAGSRRRRTSSPMRSASRATASRGRAPAARPIRGGGRRSRSRSWRRPRWATRPWSCARPASWPTISRSSTTSTSRRRSIAEGAGIRFARTEMPNADPAFLDVLSDVLRDHLAGVAAP